MMGADEMLANIAAVSLGAAAGACLRWGLGLLLADAATAFAAGTLVANWLGGFAIGVFAGLDGVWPGITPQLRLLVVTGFLGGLTTFSGFSLEIVAMMQQQRYADAAVTVSLHLFGSLVLTALGIWCVHAWRG